MDQSYITAINLIGRFCVWVTNNYMRVKMKSFSNKLFANAKSHLATIVKYFAAVPGKLMMCRM